LTVPSIRAVVLDMDGLLIDTEPVWRTAARDILAPLGIDLTDADLLDTTGVRVDEMAASFLASKPPPVPSTPLRSPTPPESPGPPVPSPAEVADRITDQVVAYVARAGEEPGGVRPVLRGSRTDQHALGPARQAERRRRAARREAVPDGG